MPKTGYLSTFWRNNPAFQQHLANFLIHAGVGEDALGVLAQDTGQLRTGFGIEGIGGIHMATFSTARGPAPVAQSGA